MDIQGFFDERLPAALAANEADARRLGVSYQLQVTGDGGGDWNVQCTEKGVSCRPGVGSATSSLTVDAANFETFVKNPVDFGLVATGKLKVRGSFMSLIWLRRIFAYDPAA